jgi:hypothetical protein
MNPLVNSNQSIPAKRFWDISARKSRHYFDFIYFKRYQWLGQHNIRTCSLTVVLRKLLSIYLFRGINENIQCMKIDEFTFERVQYSRARVRFLGILMQAPEPGCSVCTRAKKNSKSYSTQICMQRVVRAFWEIFALLKPCWTGSEEELFSNDWELW